MTEQTLLKQRVRRVSLGFMGEEWKEGYIDFRYMGLEDSRKNQEREAQTKNGDGYRALEVMKESVTDAFIAGKALNARDELVDITAQDITGFDLEAIGYLYERVLGIPDPKASKP